MDPVLRSFLRYLPFLIIHERFFDFLISLRFTLPYGDISISILFFKFVGTQILCGFLKERIIIIIIFFFFFRKRVLRVC